MTAVSYLFSLLYLAIKSELLDKESSKHSSWLRTLNNHSFSHIVAPFAPVFAISFFILPPRSIVLFDALPEPPPPGYSSVSVSCHLHNVLLACFARLRERWRIHTVLYPLATSNEQGATHRTRSPRCSGLRMSLLGVSLATFVVSSPPRNQDSDFPTPRWCTTGAPLIRCGFSEFFHGLPKNFYGAVQCFPKPTSCAPLGALPGFPITF